MFNEIRNSYLNKQKRTNSTTLLQLCAINVIFAIYNNYFRKSFENSAKLKLITKTRTFVTKFKNHNLKDRLKTLFCFRKDNNND